MHETLQNKASVDSIICTYILWRTKNFVAKKGLPTGKTYRKVAKMGADGPSRASALNPTRHRHYPGS
jgi:hypothetical protein